MRDLLRHFPLLFGVGLIAGACGGSVTVQGADGGSTQTSPSSSSSAPGGRSFGSGSSEEASFGPGPSTGSSIVPSFSASFSTGPDEGPDGGPGKCTTLSVLGGGGGGCAVDRETCGGVNYEVTCNCAEAKCTCIGPSSAIVDLAGCPTCPSFNHAFALCGFPQQP